MKTARASPLRAASELPEAAVAALRACALLDGGVPAARVWRVLGKEQGASKRLAHISAQLEAGVSEELAFVAGGGAQWQVLAAAWGLAQQSGAPVSYALHRIAEGLRELDRLQQRRQVLLAGPRATIRLVAVLPVVALLTGVVLGFDPIGVLLTPFGALIALAGAVLLVSGVCWATALATQLAAAEWVAGLECELSWIALSGGAAPQIAIRRVADQIDRIAALYREVKRAGVSGIQVRSGGWNTLSRVLARKSEAEEAAWLKLAALCEDAPTRQAVRLAAAHGTPAGPMLLAAATTERARVLNELEQAAERLAVRILLPIAMCVLPSFIMLGVLPVLLAVLGSLGPLG